MTPSCLCTRKIAYLILQIPTDFFGRPVTKPIPVSASGQDEEAEGKLTTSTYTPSLHRAWADSPALPLEPVKTFRALYKFHEGSSSAVRKSIKMSTLM
jgi:hypothetical protein